MNSLFVDLGIESWKPVLSMLMLPPVPLLLIVLAGAWMLRRRPVAGWIGVWLGVALLWLCACAGTATFLSQTLLRPPPALEPARIARLRAEVRAAPRAVTIVVLGGGMERFAPEYDNANLNWISLERLRYGVWLSRESGASLGFSGGVGWAQQDPGSMAEARVAARIAANDFARPMAWAEDQSRDTRENAARTIALLKPAGVRHIVVVTHDFHMPRAVRAFEQAAGPGIRIEAAPMGGARQTGEAITGWTPSERGLVRVRFVVHELLGRWFGA